ncbi:CDP-glycerol glycerophosphotransferase family protein [Clostridium perfringens]|nr:CDP-glycerol glycerophosphotransferase family protein [Clostridium perfringens]MDM0931865.1 CDP-glycerol glycerophosphotransferase family protein [Clostridium perfringens]MDU4500678.1 CDP-glycerol glycerophosphotransferase family protein [Clostridium perfringens]
MSKFILKFKHYITLFMVRFFCFFPIKNNKIFLYSYYGSQYGCNPKYISEYLIKNHTNKYDIVWAFNDLESKKDIQGIRKVKIMSLKYFYELCTSKVIITNFRTTEIFRKRRGQYYIQTWHSSLRLKQIEKDAEDKLQLQYIKMAKEDSKKIDLLLSGCKLSTNIFKRAFWYDGEIFEYGTPRNDILIKNKNELNNIIKEKLNIGSNKKIILYAPTFRKNNDLSIYNISYSKIIYKLKEKFGGDWIFLVKLHPHLILKSKDLVWGDEILDVTAYDDIQELLSISDILISDYSSLIFDFALTKKPCFLYVPDIDQYIKNDRNLYFNIDELPFIKTKNNEELEYEIYNFNNEDYKVKLGSFSNKIGNFELGICCEKLEKRLDKVCFN